MQYVFSLWLFVVAIALWVVGVITAKTPPALTEAMRMPMAYYLRATAYFLLLTEDWPPIDPGVLTKDWPPFDPGPPSGMPSGTRDEQAVTVGA